MKIVVFLGPTLSHEQASGFLDAVYLPPAAQGDLYRAAQSRPNAIGLIDGYFSSVPSVRHKEILWAMSEGIHVFGAASIGALRAAELTPFGMVGIGEVFEAYQTGVLEDDDEVAVEHGPQDLGYRPVSDAMVNIRATFDAAESSGIIDAGTRTQLVCMAKQAHYRERSYRLLLARAKGQMSTTVLDRLADWIPENCVDRKADDAIALLSALSGLAADTPPFKAGFTFSRTEAWERLKAETAVVGAADNDVAQRDFLDELRLVPGLYRRVCETALARGLVLREADRQGLGSDVGTRDDLVADWRARQGIEGYDDLASWMHANALDEAGFETFVREEERRRRVFDMAESLKERHILNALRASGDFARFFVRARNKQRSLEEKGVKPIGPERSVERLASWFASRRLGLAGPIDPEQLAMVLGFPDAQALHRALIREYDYIDER